MNTLNIQEAAQFLRIHPVTLGIKARQGIIPGTKVGKCWVFVDVDLIAYIRSQYQRQDLQGDRKEIQCHSSNDRTHAIGGLSFSTTEERYNEVLALPTKRER